PRPGPAGPNPAGFRGFRARPCGLAVRAATAGRRTLRTRSHTRPDDLAGEPGLSVVVHSGARAADSHRIRVRRRTERARGTSLGRDGPDLRGASGDLEHQL